MSETTEIRRHANGSIDIEYYAKIGRSLHAQAIQEAGGGLGVKLREMNLALISRLRRFSRRVILNRALAQPYSNKSSSMATSGLSAGGMG